MDFSLMKDSLLPLIGAIPSTLILSLSSVFIGFFIAILITLGRLSPYYLLSRLCYGYVYIFRSTPLLVQIFLIYYGSGQFRHALDNIGLWSLFREPWFCAILALSLNTAAYSSEIMRGGILSVPKGVWEAAQALGLSRRSQFYDVVFPQALRQALPSYGNEIILMVKASSLASTITILEITGVAEKIITETFKPLEIFIIAGAIYLGLNFIIALVISSLERKINVH